MLMLKTADSANEIRKKRYGIRKSNREIRKTKSAGNGLREDEQQGRINVKICVFRKVVDERKYLKYSLL